MEYNNDKYILIIDGKIVTGLKKDSNIIFNSITSNFNDDRSVNNNRIANIEFCLEDDSEFKRYLTEISNKNKVVDISIAENNYENVKIKGSGYKIYSYNNKTYWIIKEVFYKNLK